MRDSVLEPISSAPQALSDYGDMLEGGVLAPAVGVVRTRFPETSKTLGLGDDAYWEKQRKEGKEAAEARGGAIAAQLVSLREDAEFALRAASSPAATARKAAERTEAFLRELSASDERRRRAVEDLAESLARAVAQRTIGRTLGIVAGKGRSDPLGSNGGDAVSRVYPEKGPYDPKGTREVLEDRYGKDTVTSTTQPKGRDKGMTFQNKSGDEAMRAGEPSPVLGAPNPRTGKLYDRKGEPNLDADAKISVDIANPTRDPKRRSIDKRQAVKELKQMLRDNPQLRKRFDEDQLAAIDAGKTDIPRLVWDRDRRRGRLKSVERKAHEENVHVGRFGMDNKGKGR